MARPDVGDLISKLGISLSKLRISSIELGKGTASAVPLRASKDAGFSHCGSPSPIAPRIFRFEITLYLRLTIPRGHGLFALRRNILPFKSK
jgi:hypothetical protein